MLFFFFLCYVVNEKYNFDKFKYSFYFSGKTTHYNIDELKKLNIFLCYENILSIMHLSRLN